MSLLLFRYAAAAYATFYAATILLRYAMLLPPDAFSAAADY